jgi:hypothetical protein
MFFAPSARWPSRLGLCLLLLGVSLLNNWAQENLLSEMNDTDDAQLVDDPWGGVIDGAITAPPGTQLAVDDDGKVKDTVFGPSIAVGDLNGDGLPDLVMADAKGYFYYFPNSGTATQPKFATSEVIPLWLGAPFGPTGDDWIARANYRVFDNIVSRIQLVDFSGEKKLSLVAGNFEGKLFYIHNLGSATVPVFTLPSDLDAITVPTYSNHLLWCNYLAPFLYDFTGTGRLDLVMGEGTYASNSIYLITNKGSNLAPAFNELNTTKIIPGYGREHLIPQVVDWNNDGKPDIICGERGGYIDLFLNTSPDKSLAHLQFDNPPPPATPAHVKFGGDDQLGTLTTVTVCDLTHNGMPNLILSNSDGVVKYAQNKGTPGSPKFDSPVPIRAVNPLPKIYQAPENWVVKKGFSMPYFLVASTNAKDDPTFVPPKDDPKIKSAIKAYTVPHPNNVYFRKQIYPSEDTRIVECTTGIDIEANTHYTISFWFKTAGDVQNPRYFFQGLEYLQPQGITAPDGSTTRIPFIPNTISGSGDWSKVEGDVFYPRLVDGKPETAPLQFYMAFNGNDGTVWMADFQMKKTQ